MSDNDRLIDQACDTYCHSIARIDTLGPNRRLIFTVPSVDSTGYQNVVVKLILPAELMMTLARLAVGCDRVDDRATLPPEMIAFGTETVN
jgi:hypothetical protein